MKAIIPPQYTSAQRKAVLEEIRKDCVSEVRKYEVLMDAVVFDAVAKRVGYDKQLLKEIYDEVSEQRDRAKAEYQREGLTMDMAAFFDLQVHGIDIMRWSEEYDGRIEVEI